MIDAGSKMVLETMQANAMEGYLGSNTALDSISMENGSSKEASMEDVMVGGAMQATAMEGYLGSNMVLETTMEDVMVARPGGATEDAGSNEHTHCFQYMLVLRWYLRICKLM